MGFFHPIFPLIPVADWEEQLRTGRELMREVFGRAPRGFWPPEMAFSMEMIPALAKAGYDYVVVDGVHVHPADGVSDVFRPYIACHDGVCITVVPARSRRLQCPGKRAGRDWFRPRGHASRPLLAAAGRAPAGHHLVRRRERRLVSADARGLRLLRPLLRALHGARAWRRRAPLCPRGSRPAARGASDRRYWPAGCSLKRASRPRLVRTLPSSRPSRRVPLALVML